MKWNEAANRLNGFSIASIGVQWTPKPTDSEVARRVIQFLEDRRVLYSDYAWEEPNHCIESVLEIRRFLTSEIADLTHGSDLLSPFRAIRAACRKFLDRMHHDGHRRVRLHHGMESFDFYSALGELRGCIGPQIALLAASYKVDVEDELARILPVPDQE
ncbi:MAG TPA: DUF6650 family protein [Bryobacteraceae bacterium]|nr:DUF6650 family protein [Bryobacteraceae bacterium]